MPPHVIFDLDGTLIDSAPDIREVANAVLAEEGAAPLTLAEARGFVGGGAGIFVERTAEARGLPPERRPAMLERFLELYEGQGATRLTRPYPGAVEALATLGDRGHALGICTNKPDGPMRRVLADLDLAGPFAALVAGDTLPVRKPDPAPLRECVARLGGGPALFVGDSEIDCETARRAGIAFALFTEGYRRDPLAEVPPAMRFDDFRRLPGIAAEVVARAEAAGGA